MPKSANQKQKLLYLMHWLLTETDELRRDYVAHLEGAINANR